MPFPCSESRGDIAPLPPDKLPSHPTASASLASSELYLVFGELELDFVRIIGNLQLGIQVILCILQPINQLLPSFVELQRNRSKFETSH